MLNNVWTLWLCGLKGKARSKSRAPQRRRRRTRLESLEERTLLTGQTFYVDDSYTITNDVGPAGLSAGDTVTWSPGDPNQVTGLVYGTTAFSDIQSAINAASDGDTIDVARGTYTLSTQINVNKQVTILGAQANVDPTGATTRIIGGSAESIINSGALARAFSIQNSNVTINGFDISGSTTLTGALIDSGGTAAYTTDTIQDNFVHDNNTSGGVKGIRLTAISNSLVTHNDVFTVADDGIEIGANAQGVSQNDMVSYNEVHDLGSGGTTNSALYAFAVGGPAAQVNFIGVTFQGNLVYNHFGNDAIKIGAKNGQDAAATGGSIIGNIVHDTAQDGITVDARNVTVSGNEVYNSFSTNGAIYVEWSNGGVNIHNNSVHDNSAGQAAILIGFNGHNVSGVSVNNNSIVNNTNNTLFFRDNNGGTATIDASGNYWGSADPGVVGSEVKSVAGTTPTTGRIDFTYWLNNATDTSTDPGFQPDFSSLTVAPSTKAPLQTGSLGRIQEGIEAASTGGTVNVLAGNYSENVNLDKDVTVAFVDSTTVTGLISGSTGTYEAGGSVTLGDATSSSGISFSSNLLVDPLGNLTLLDADGAELDGQTFIYLASLNSATGVTIGSGGSLVGLGGLGTTAVTIAKGGSIDPGYPVPAAAGGLSMGALTLDPGSTSIFDVNYPVSPGATYDQITANGASLAGTLTINPGNTVNAGDQFTIIANTSGKPISGTFDGLAEGAKFTAGGTEFSITYKGGEFGDDVVLTALDSTAPTVTVTSPTVTGGVAYSKTGTLTISGTVTDPPPSSGIASVTVSIDGNPPIAATFGGGTWSASISGLADGSHNILVTATDNDSNSGTDDFTLIVDSVAPTVTVTNPTITAGVGYSKVSNPIISGTVADGSPSSGIASVMLSIDGNAPVAATVNGGTWSYSASGLADGSHTISVVAADNAGNLSTPDNFTLDVDTVIPTVTVTNPTITAGVAYSKVSNPIISGTVADASPSSGIASVLLSIDGNAPVAAVVSAGTWSYSASGLADGTHTISVVATDNAGNQSTADNFQLKVDTVIPTVTVTNPTITAGVAYSKVGNPVISGTVADASPSSGIASVLLSIDGNAPVAATVTGGTWSYSASGLADGSHTVSVIATDNAGNQSTADNFTLKVDTVAPTLTITNPTITAGLAYSKVNNPVIAGTVADASPSSGIASVLLTIDGNAPVAATLAGGNWSYNTSGLADGTHTILVVATDNAGNQSAASSFTLKVDTVIPTVTVTNPTITAGVAYSKTSSLTFTGTVADASPSSGIASVLLTIDGNAPVAATVTGGTWSYSASGLADGSHTISVVAADNAGNQSTATNFTLKVDTVAPTLTVTNPTLTAGVGYSTTSSPTISGTVADANPSSGIASVMLTIDGNAPVAATVNAGAWTYNASGLADGNHTISVVAKDNAGNSSATTTFTLKVDTAAPTLTVTNPTITAGVAYSKTSSPTISGTVADGSPSSGIASVMLTIDGNAPVAATVNAGAWTYNASGLSDGNHTITVVAKDNAGNSSATTSFTLKVDTVVPTLTVTSPTITAGVAYSKTSSATISGTVGDASPSSGIASVLLTIDGNAPVAATVNAGTWTYNASGLTDGNHTITVVAKDNAGNSSATTSFTLKVDTVAPTVAVTNPTITAGVGYSKTSSPTISGTVGDASPSSGIASVMLTIDGNPPVAATVNAGAWSYNASGLADGNHTITVVAKDNAGNSSATTSFTLKVDTVAPTLTVTTPPIVGGVATVNTNTPAFAGTVGDASPSSGLLSVTLSVDGGAAANATINNGNWSYSGATIANGDHSIAVTAKDNAGNTTTVNFTLHVDSTLPTITIPGGPLTYTANGSPITVAPGATVTDPGASSFMGGNLTVSIKTNADPNDKLVLVNQGMGIGQVAVFGSYVYYQTTLIGTVSGGTGGSPLVVSFTSSAVTPSVAQAVARDITFSNTSSSPSGAPRTIEFVITDGRPKSSLPADVTVNVSVPHVAPVVNLHTSGITFQKQSPPVLLAPAATVSSNMASFPGGTLTVSFTVNGTAADNLQVINQGQITVNGTAVSYGANVIGTISGGTAGSPLVISLNSNASVTATQALIQAIAFANSSATPSTAARTVQFVLNDGAGGNSTPVTEQVNVFVSPVTITPQSSTVGYTVGNSAVTLLPSASLADSATSSFTGSKLTVSSNQSGDQLTIQNIGGIKLTGSVVTYNNTVIGTYSAGTVTLTSLASLTSINALMQSFGFTSTGPTGAHTVTFQFTDGFGNTGSAFVTVNVTNGNARVIH